MFNVRPIRFEEISMNPYKYTKEVLNFFDLDFHHKVVEFLRIHTEKVGDDIRGVNGTVKVSKNVPFQWRQKLSFNEIRNVEKNCEKAMDLWGYLNTNGEHNLSNFYPLKAYK